MFGSPAIHSEPCTSPLNFPSCRTSTRRVHTVLHIITNHSSQRRGHRGNATRQSLMRLLSLYHVMQSKSWFSFEDQASVDEIYGCPIFKWGAVTWLWIGHCDSSPSNGRQGDMPYSLNPFIGYKGTVQIVTRPKTLGYLTICAPSHTKTAFLGIGIPMWIIRYSRDRLIFNMEIIIPVRHFYIDWTPAYHSEDNK